MPQLKQPMRLEEMTIRGFYNRYVGNCQKWMQVLGEADERNVLRECRQMEDEISKLPPAILKWLSPRLAKKFVKLIRAYDNENLSTLRLYPWALYARNKLFKAVFRSVLTRYVQKLDTRGLLLHFVRDVILENLDAVPGLLELHLDCRCRDHSKLLALMSYLENLQVFTHLVHCTDNIIEQLQRHCPHLTELVVTNSRQVTNASVQPLRKARKLYFLDLNGTEIDDEHYGMLLSELPNISNITFRQMESSILRHIAVESLDTITHVKGYIPDIDTVTHKFPNITNITMCPFPRYMSGLTTLNVSRNLEICSLDYVRSNFKAVLQSVGHRLTDLELSHVHRVDLQDIITLCPSLISLSLIQCTFLYLHSDTPLDPQLPHFRNLINLLICSHREYPDIRYFRYYVNLKTINFLHTRRFTVEFVTEILNLGTYKQLEVLRLAENLPEAITAKALELLIGHCPLLKRIELVGITGRRLKYVFGELKHRILLQNFDLKFKLKDKIVIRNYKRDTDCH
jgi:hypothetical protein